MDARTILLVVALVAPVPTAGCLDLPAPDGSPDAAAGPPLTLADLNITHRPAHPASGATVHVEVRAPREANLFLNYESFWGHSSGGAIVEDAATTLNTTAEDGEAIVYHAGAINVVDGRAAPVVSPAHVVRVPPQQGAPPDVTLTLRPENPTANDTLHVTARLPRPLDADVRMAHLYAGPSAAGSGGERELALNANATAFEGELNLTRLLESYAPHPSADVQEGERVLVVMVAARYGRDGAVGVAEERVVLGREPFEVVDA